MSFAVVLAPEALDDLERLFDFILERESRRPGGGDPALAQRAIDALHAGFKTLESSPFTCRKAGASPFVRELIVPFGGTGYVALFEIVGDGLVVVGAVRHQRESDYH
jgi:plasmid stabilization system protein ParE